MLLSCRSVVLWRALARLGYRCPKYTAVAPEALPSPGTPQTPVSILRGSATPAGQAKRKVRMGGGEVCGGGCRDATPCSSCGEVCGAVWCASPSPVGRRTHEFECGCLCAVKAHVCMCECS
jgi:hypothetical protein